MSVDGHHAQTERTPAMDDTEAVAFQPGWLSRNQLPSFSPLEGFTMQSVTGGQLMANWVTIEPK